MQLHEELTNLGLSAYSIPDLDWKRFQSLHRKVGKVQLYKLTNQVNLALELTGRSERVTEGKYRSVYTPEMLTEPLVKFCKGSKFQPRNRKALEQAIKSVTKKLGVETTEPISLEESYQRLLSDKADHFAGLPTLGKKGDDVDALTRAEQCWRGKCPPPAIIGHRGKNTEVVRAVWMFPFEWHIVEGAFYYPLYDLIKRVQNIYPVGVISERRYNMRKYCELNYNTKFSIDYSGFDASINTQMIGIAYSILSKLLRLTDKAKKVWERVQTYFATCPFLAPNGRVYKGRKGGVPSGSMFTQLVDTICNAVAIEYAMICERIRQYRYQVYGDDSWTICKIGETPRAFLKKIAAHVKSLGLKMNTDKTVYAEPKTPIVFCGHYDIQRGRPLQDAIDKLCYPERPSARIMTREGICERIMAYIADADSLALNSVYLANYHDCDIPTVLRFGNHTCYEEVLRQKAEGKNRRHMPGIMQVLDAIPREASTLMKIRSAI